MKGKKSLIVLLFLVMGIAIISFSTTGSTAQTAATAELSNSDCVKCHKSEPADLDSSGGKHKGVGCIGCHVGHRPSVKDNVPKCSMCHTGKSHFDLIGCLSCHKNPHKPLSISFGGNVTEPCLTCHTQQIKQLKEHKSKHTMLNCSTCHNVHRKVPECTQCHKPHASGMAASECKKCHKAHMPKDVTYASDTPSKDCGACHKKALDLLAASKAKHKTFECAFCHQAKHKMIPKCQDCHGTPHPAGMMAKFPKCGECHNIAHDLNNWPATVEKPAPAKKKSK